MVDHGVRHLRGVAAVERHSQSNMDSRRMSRRSSGFSSALTLVYISNFCVWPQAGQTISFCIFVDIKFTHFLQTEPAPAQKVGVFPRKESSGPQVRLLTFILKRIIRRELLRFRLFRAQSFPAARRQALPLPRLRLRYRPARMRLLRLPFPLPAWECTPARRQG